VATYSYQVKNDIFVIRMIQ